MADNWYYVHKGNRQGPVPVEVLNEMISRSDLREDDFVWKKGFENWKKIREVEELQTLSAPAPTPSPARPVPVKKEAAAETPKMEFKELNLKTIHHEDRSIFIRTGDDRGAAIADYGPFSVKQLQQLFKENRINGKTLIFSAGMKDWKFLADFNEYQEIFEETPPHIQDTDRRKEVRKPFVARLLVHNSKTVFNGICRDISIGGMQILVDNFKGNAGERISINVHPDNSDFSFTASGTVVRILEGNSGFSFRFETLNEEAKRAIEKYLQDK